MINLERNRKLYDLQAELENLNSQYQRKKVQFVINALGNQFKEFFEKKGFKVNRSVYSDCSPQMIELSTESGNIKIKLIGNYRDTNLEYFELKWNDNDFTKHRLLIFSNENAESVVFDREKSDDIDKTIENTELEISFRKSLIQSSNTFTFDYFLADGKNPKERKQIYSLTEVLNEHFS